MEKSNGPWNLSPEKAQEIDDIRARETIKKESFNDLEKQLNDYLEEKQLQGVRCIASPEEQQIDILSSGNYEIERIYEFLEQIQPLINNLFDTHQIDAACKIVRDKQHIQVKF